jgi:two-component system sensor histidine kinase KdpD
MHGTVQPEDTPGGGLTMVVSVPAAKAEAAPVPGSRDRSAPESENIQ